MPAGACDRGELFLRGSIAAAHHHNLQRQFGVQDLAMDRLDRPDAQAAGKLQDNGAVVSQVEPSFALPCIARAGKEGMNRDAGRGNAARERLPRRQDSPGLLPSP